MSPRMDSDSGNPPISGGIQFLGGGSLFQKFYLEIVAEVRPGVRVTVREKGQELEFPATSGCGKILFGILGSPAVTW